MGNLHQGIVYVHNREKPFKQLGGQETVIYENVAQ